MAHRICEHVLHHPPDGRHGRSAKVGFAAVTSTFAAVEALSGSLALELAPTRVSTIRPGFIDTEMWSFLPAEHRDGLRKKVEETFPSRRAGNRKTSATRRCS